MTRADDTAKRLQDAANGGAPLMIPGAREPRVKPATPQPAAPAVFYDPAAGVDDPARLEREREGGGAPSERRQP